MIRTIYMGIAVAALAAGTVACDPRAFSDLEEETWVVTSGQPSGMESDDYVFALTFAATTTAEGSRLVVMGNGPASVGTIRYSANGSTDSSGKRFTDLIMNLDSTTFDSRRPLAGSTAVIGTDGTVAIGLPEEANGTGDTGSVLLVDLSTMEPHRQLFPVPGLADQGAAVALGATDYEDAGQGPGPDLLTSARNNVVLYPDVLTRPGLSPFNCPVGREVVHAVLAADVEGGDTGDEVLIMRGDTTLDGTATASDITVTTGGNIVAASEDMDTNLCFDAGAAVPRAALVTVEAPGNERDFGLTLLAADFNGNGITDIVATAPSSNTVYVFLDFDIATVDAPDITITAPSGAVGFGAAIAAGDLDGVPGDELAIGAPNSSIDDTAGAGTVFVYKLGLTTSADLVNRLHDVEPEADQQFGRAVTIAPFGSAGGILAVGAAGELFTYFRTSVDFPDVRQ